MYYKIENFYFQLRHPGFLNAEEAPLQIGVLDDYAGEKPEGLKVYNLEGSQTLLLKPLNIVPEKIEESVFLEKVIESINAARKELKSDPEKAVNLKFKGDVPGRKLALMVE